MSFESKLRDEGGRGGDETSRSGKETIEKAGNMPRGEEGRIIIVIAGREGAKGAERESRHNKRQTDTHKERKVAKTTREKEGELGGRSRERERSSEEGDRQQTNKRIAVQCG